MGTIVYHKSSIHLFVAVLLIAIISFVMAACSEKDFPEEEPVSPDTPSIEIPTEDVIQTYIETSVATLGSGFDETTERLIARARDGVSVAGQTPLDIPEGTGVLFIDAPSLEQVLQTSDAGDFKEIAWLNHLFQNGTVIMLHKPDNMAAALFTLLLQWDSFVLNDDGIYSMGAADFSELQSSKQKIRDRQLKSRAVDNDSENSLDLYGIRDGYHYYFLPNVYEADESIIFQGTQYTQIDDQEETSTDFEATLTAQQPSAYSYGLIAEEAVNWINQTSEQISANGVKAMMSRADVSGDIRFFDQVASSQATIITESVGEGGKGSVTMPITCKFWISAIYNFEKDEDYYHIVMEEKIPAQILYVGAYQDPFYDYNIRTWRASLDHFSISAYWNHASEYPIIDHWNALPQGQASPTTYETINGWDLNAEVSFGKSITGKLSGKYQSKETVTTTKNDVDVTYKSNFDNKNYQEFGWNYVLGNQPAFSGTKGKLYDPKPASNASCISEQTYRQSWNWLVKSTQKRKNDPFSMTIHYLEYLRCGHAKKGFLMTSKETYIWGNMECSFNIQLPVPERFKKVYSFTLDESADASELSELLKVMEKVVPNFKGLFETLQRTDDKGILLGRTGVTMSDVENTVGAEWYALAKEIAARKFGVKHTYRFYVKDMSTSNGKLEMKVCQNGVWKSMGVYVEIGPEGSKILTQAEADAEDNKNNHK